MNCTHMCVLRAHESTVFCLHGKHTTHIYFHNFPYMMKMLQGDIYIHGDVSDADAVSVCEMKTGDDGIIVIHLLLLVVRPICRYMLYNSAQSNCNKNT